LIIFWSCVIGPDKRILIMDLNRQKYIQKKRIRLDKRIVWCILVIESKSNIFTRRTR